MNARLWIKRVLIALLIAAAVLGGVWGFGMLGQTGMPREDEQRPIILGFSQLGSESGWRIGNTRSVVKAAADAGIQLMERNAEQKQEKATEVRRRKLATLST